MQSLEQKECSTDFQQFFYPTGLEAVVIIRQTLTQHRQSSRADDVVISEQSETAPG